MAEQSTVLTFDVIRSISSASMTGSFIPVGTAFTSSVRILKLVNNTNQDASVSIDGTNTHDFIPAGGFALYDSGTNRGNASSSLSLSKGDQIYVSSAAGTGSFYVVVLYAYTPSFQIPGL